MYGPELILDLHGCDVKTFNRKSLQGFCRELCREIGMTPHKFRSIPWDDDGVPIKECQVSPVTKGWTAVQFLMESSILVHTLELTQAVYVNIFSCKKFKKKVATEFTQNWFGADDVTSRKIQRI